ncbi:S8 family serine peptidase [Arsukibacterium sp.]|uniref:S8 family serine peptidase n=1 Tax=Arsukibacterium sp. TaxID=1977258 RepID=UPI001BD2D41E|nr:S8 family serine peptidase [Arsukibacterium sp.]
MKTAIIIGTLLLAATANIAEAGERHLVLLKGSAKNFNTSVATLGGEVVYRHDATGFAVVEGLSDDGLSQLSLLNSVDEIAPNFTFNLPDTMMGSTSSVELQAIENNDNPSNAFFFPRQWNLQAIQVADAWALGRTGSAAVTVAVLDTGIAYTHIDLDGLVDLDRSASFLPQDDELVNLYFPGMHPITDLHYHGTHVASTISSNAIAAAGVTSHTTLMGVKVCSVYGGCPGDAIFMGLAHAIDNGADIINMSLGGTFSKSEFQGYVGFLNKFFNYARAQGVTVVVSAGNSAIDMDHDGNGYKTYCSTPSTVCVSATGPESSESINGPWLNIDSPATYTNYGRSAINVAAPGGNNGISVFAACSNTSLVIPVCRTASSFIVGLSGTSMAAPHVSGLAAMMVEDVGRSPAKIKAALEKSADDLGQAGTDPFYGKGRINALNAVQ